MLLTQYDQRLTLAEGIDYGRKETLPTGGWQQLDKEHNVIPPSNYYLPFTVSKRLREWDSADYSDEEKEFGTTGRKEFILDSQQHNHEYDPFRGNTFALTNIGTHQFMLISSGESLSDLCVVSLSEATLDIVERQVDSSHTFTGADMPVGDMYTAVKMHMSFPILQITVSEAKDVISSNNAMIIGVRTTQSTSILKMTLQLSEPPRLTKLHHFEPNKPMRGRQYPCLPSHLALSPYTGNQFAFVGDTGYVSLFDIGEACTENPLGKLYEFNQNVKEPERYSRRWNACVFGPHSRSLIVASFNRIELLDFRANVTESERVLYTSAEGDRIYALAALNSKYTFQFCVTTDQQLLLMDTRYPCQPVIRWEHHQSDYPPIFMQIFKDPSEKDIVNVIGWSLRADNAIHVRYNYSGKLEYRGTTSSPSVRPATYSLPKFLLLPPHEKTYLILEKHTLPTIGACAKLQLLRSASDSRSLMIFFRSLGDGAVYAQFHVQDPLNDAPLLNRHQHVSYAVQHSFPLFQIGSNSCDDDDDNGDDSKDDRMSVDSDDGVYYDDDDDSDDGRDDILRAHERLLQQEDDERRNCQQIWNAQPLFKKIMEEAVLPILSSKEQHKTLAMMPMENAEDHVAGNIHTLIKLKEIFELDDSYCQELDKTIIQQGFSRPISHAKPKDISHWLPVPGQENTRASAYTAVTESVCHSLVNMNETERENREKLNNRFADDVFFNTMYYLRKPENDPEVEAKRTFQYLRQKKDALSIFQPTRTTMFLGSEWVPGKFQHQVPQYDKPMDPVNSQQPLFYYHHTPTEIAAQATLSNATSDTVFRRLPSASFDAIHEEQEEVLPPAIQPASTQSFHLDSSQEVPGEFSSISTQPLPGAFANRPKKEAKKKKKKVVSGFM